ncbi:MAG: hypothetical protein ACLQBA_07450 [Candidatus Binataceae bacterium]
MALFGKQLTISGEGVAVFQNAAGGQTNAGQGAINLDNILKLIPGDVVSLYMTGIGLAVGGQNGAMDPGAILFGLRWPTICFWICMGACLLLRILASKPVGAAGMQDVNWGLVLMTCIAFFIWAHAVSDTGPVIRGFHGAVAGFIAMVVGLFAPLAAQQT